MAQITDKAAAAAAAAPAGGGGTVNSTVCFFLGCFGGINNNNNNNNKGSVEKGEKARSSVCFSWSKLKKRSFPRKTVPLEYGDNNKVHSRKGSFFHRKSGNKKLKDQIPGSDIKKIVHDDQPNQTKYDNVQEIILNNNSKSKNHLDSSKKPTCKKALSGTLLRSNTASPEDKFEVLSRGEAAGLQLSHSVSMPPAQPPRRKKKTVNNNNNKNNNISGGNSKVNDKKRIDQFLGITMFMVTLTLIVMIFCGKICAILCTCGWFYFYPIIVVSREKNEPKVGFGEEIIGSKSAADDEEIDFNSPEYKKKVVLEGFLERSHRIH